MKLLKGIAIGGIVILVGRFIYNLKRAENKAAVQVGGRVHKLTTQGVELFIDYNIKNPSESVMEMAIPLITLKYKGALLASSSMTPMILPSGVSVNNAGRIPIGAHSETGVITTKVLIPYLSMVGLGVDLVKLIGDRIKGGDTEIKLNSEVNTSIYAGPLTIPYDDVQTLTI